MINLRWYMPILWCIIIVLTTVTHVMAENTVSIDHEAVWAELNAKIMQAYEQGHYDEGIESAQKASQYALKHLGKDHPATLNSINNLAFLYDNQGRYEEAEPLYQEVLRGREQVLGREHPDTLTAINNLAFLYEHQGRYDEAEPLYQEVLRGRKQVLGRVHPDTLQSIHQLAFFYDSQGRYDEEEPLLLEAVRQCDQVLGREHPDTLDAINNLAFLYHRQGRYDESEPLYQEAVQLGEQVLGREHPSTLLSIDNLAVLYEDQGRYDEAEPLYQEVLRGREQVLGREHPDTLDSIDRLAFFYNSQGRYDEAEPFYQEAVRRREQVLGREHPNTLDAISNLAGLYARQGRYGEAEPLYRDAVQLSEQVLGGVHPHTLTRFSKYIILMVNMEKPGTAFQLLKKMEERLFSHPVQELYATSEDHIRHLFSENMSDFQDIAFSFAAQFPERDHIRYAADVALRWKQMYAEEYALHHRLLCFSDDPAITRLREEIAQLRSDFSHHLHQPGTGQELGCIMQALNTAEGALRDKTRALTPELSVSGGNTDRLLGTLPERSALLEFKRFTRRDFKTGEAVSQNWAAYLLLPTIDADQHVVFADLGSEEELFTILHTSDDPMSGLYTMFFKAFEPCLKDVDTLYVAPDGFLHLVPFAALKTPDDRYLAQQFTLRQLQTGRDLLDTSTDIPANTLIAMGGVDYGHLPEQSAAVGIPDDVQTALAALTPNLQAAGELDGGMKNLPNSLNEVETIEALFTANTKDGHTHLYTAQEAAEGVLKNLADAPRILHLSTHGFYLQQAEDSPLDEAEPMVLSGLALAGANQGLQGLLDANGEDGLLYSLEVLGLHLQGTEVVSLSACETGKDVIDYSEGVYGLIRAFRTAGARNVLMTLSNVGDNRSKEFMVKFYELWLTSPEDTSPSDALNATWNYFITHENPTYRDPAFWSPYVMVGAR